MLGQALDEREEAALGIKPRVGLELLIVRLKALYDAAYAKFII